MLTLVANSTFVTFVMTFVAAPDGIMIVQTSCGTLRTMVGNGGEPLHRVRRPAAELQSVTDVSWLLGCR